MSSLYLLLDNLQICDMSCKEQCKALDSSRCYCFLGNLPYDTSNKSKEWHIYIVHQELRGAIWLASPRFPCKYTLIYGVRYCSEK